MVHNDLLEQYTSLNLFTGIGHFTAQRKPILYINASYIETPYKFIWALWKQVSTGERVNAQTLIRVNLTKSTSWSGNGTADDLQLHGKDDVAHDPLLIGPAPLANACPEDGAILPLRPKHKIGEHRHTVRMVNVPMPVAHNQFSPVSVYPYAL